MEYSGKGFFEYISAASNEKVHSQTIAWIFSENCNVLSPLAKSDILKSLILFDKNQELTLSSNGFIPKKVIAEIEDIDILIVCQDYFVVIENKIKSSEHSNQLIKYEYLTSFEELSDDKISKIICNRCKPCKANPKGECEKLAKLNKSKVQLLKELHDKKGFYIYLTLIEEYKINKIEPWLPLKYKNLYHALSIEFNKLGKNDFYNKSYYILLDYLKSIKALLEIVENEKDNSLIINHIFLNGKSKKLNILLKDYSDSLIESLKEPIIRTIHENQLETILQKQFYNQILNNINIDLKENITPVVSETNGSALLDFQFDNLSFKKNNEKYTGILQFQGNSIKLAISVNKEHNSKLEYVQIKFLDKLERYIKENPNFELISFPFKITNKVNPEKKQNEIKTTGFSSIKIDVKIKNNNGFWQLENKPVTIVEDCLKFAIHFFRYFN